MIMTIPPSPWSTMGVPEPRNASHVTLKEVKGECKELVGWS
jgi:hypothetical protein